MYACARSTRSLATHRFTGNASWPRPTNVLVVLTGASFTPTIADCRLCASPDGNFYNPRTLLCDDCGDAGPSTTVWVAIVLLVLLALNRGYGLYRHGRVFPEQLRQLGGWLQRVRLANKLKILFSMYQVTTKVPTIYLVQMPDGVQDLLSTLQVPVELGFDAFASQTLQCAGLGSFSAVLLCYMLLPALVLLLVYCSFLALLLLQRRTAGSQEVAPSQSGQDGRSIRVAALFQAANWMLLVCFLAFPIVSSKAFSAFSCESFDDGSSHLRSDYAVDCNGSEYGGIVALAVFAILIYPIGVPAGTAFLLYLNRDALRNELETTGSTALAFVHAEYLPEFFWCALAMWSARCQPR